jgi:catechol 2,3-dioxygenase-like lactoylglutathione lyase family enzyme
LHLLSFLFTL